MIGVMRGRVTVAMPGAWSAGEGGLDSTDFLTPSLVTFKSWQMYIMKNYILNNYIG